ncbi:hypothetical protein BC831DRAFT_423342 [Entophlyctis helioformis]|nr:hypothetical protein BC831DRAFT_423342 [Entophlyctis helioformis]
MTSTSSPRAAWLVPLLLASFAVLVAANSAVGGPLGLVADTILAPVVGGSCADTIVSFDFSSADCYKLLLAKLLSLSIVAGSAILKVPQILNIVNSGSVEGLSFASFFIEAVAITITVAYNYRLQNPFSTYGEGVFVNAQNLVILVLILVYSGRYMALVVRSVFFAIVAFALFSDSLVGMSLLTSFQVGTIFLGMASKVPQIWSNFTAGSTGQLSGITAFLSFAGTIARVFTTLQEGLDSTILMSFLSATLFNGIIFFQIVYYNSVAPKALPAADGARAAKAAKKRD